MVGTRPAWLDRLVLAALLLVLPLVVSAANHEREVSVPALEDTLVRLAAGRVDGVLGAVGDSVRALGDMYARLAAKRAPAQDAQRWEALRTVKGRTAGFRTWPDHLEQPPDFQAPYPSFYSFNGEVLSEAVVRQLNLFEKFAPTLRTAYESFPFSWVYMSTADEAMVIYPYVPIDEAMNDDVPTRTTYYEAADFEQRAVGWTQPYLDLVGAGMMVTASYPVYGDDTLLGVMSRDITLKQLSETVLADLAAIAGSRALIVDRRGLAIGVSDAELAAEIDRVNTEAGAAVLYFRTKEGLRSIAANGAVTSSAAPVNAAVEQVLAKADATNDAIRLTTDDRPVLAARTERTSWFVVLILPEAAG